MDAFAYPLACQAIPRICAEIGLGCDLSEEVFPASQAEAAGVQVRRERLLAILSGEHGVTPYDLFRESGIGQERLALTERFVPAGSDVLDVACGRGYFTFASALSGSNVMAVDRMGDERRPGWWRTFNSARESLGLARRVSGLRADSASVPLRSDSVPVIACVHAVRDIMSQAERSGTFLEAARLLGPGGTLLVAESTPAADTPPEEVYMAYLRLRTRIGWEADVPSPGELEALVSQSGFNRVRSTLIRFDRDYAPVEFPREAVRDLPPSIREEHGRIERLRQVHGIRPTAVLAVTASEPAE